MTGMRHVVTKWSGGKIGSGYTNMYFDMATGTTQQCVDTVATFFKTAYGNGVYLPTGITLSWPGPVDTVDDASGNLLSSAGITPPSALTGSDGTAYAALGGAALTWLTGDFNAKGHRIRGRTFLVPGGGSGLQADGTLSTNFYTAVGTSAAALLSSAVKLMVWSRPTSAAATDGSSHVVTGQKVTDQVAFLTSRR